MPYCWEALENKSLRAYHKVPRGVTGVLLTDISETVQPALQKNDVLTHIDGHSIANDGQVVFRGDDELLDHEYILQGKGMDETVFFTVYRNGESVTIDPCKLSFIRNIIPRWPNVDHLPSYLIIGCFVFLPLSYSVMNSSKNVGSHLRSAYKDWQYRWSQDWENKEELVLLVDILAHDLGFSYIREWCCATKYNDVPLRSLAHLSELWLADIQKAASSTEPLFARISLEHEEDLVVDVKEAAQAQDEILRLHQIPKAQQFPTTNPMYRFKTT